MMIVIFLGKMILFFRDLNTSQKIEKKLKKLFNKIPMIASQNRIEFEEELCQENIRKFMNFLLKFCILLCNIVGA